LDATQAAAALRLLYQPIIRLADMRPTRVEVLARMMTPDGALAGPEALLAAMTDQESSMALTGMILRRGLLEQAGQLDKYGVSVIFNMPLDAMLHPRMIGIIKAIRAEGPITRLVSFELTERHPVRDVAGVGRIIAELAEAGYGVALDDVTPATPNLRALLALPLRTIKLDTSVVQSGAAADDAFIGEIVAATGARGQEVVAEGIETPETLRRMVALGVTHGQGFLFARPMTAAALPDFLDGWTFPAGLAHGEHP
jgi:EAL domain-containing protein (putative c-di-GMP-specific phosphodiesterase class I)